MEDSNDVITERQASNGDLNGWPLFRASLIPLTINVLSGLSFGYNTAVTGPVLDKLDIDWHLSKNSWDEGEITAAVLLGAAVGSSLAGIIADRYGRVPSLLLSAALGVVGAIVAAISPWWALTLVARILLGASLGIMSFVAPVYSSETVATKIRGMVIAVFQSFVCAGILLAYFLGMFLHDVPNGWRWLFSIGCSFSIIVAAMGAFRLLPESPTWLESKSERVEYQPFEQKISERVINSETEEYHPYQNTAENTDKDVLRDPSPNSVGITLAPSMEYTPFNMNGENEEKKSHANVDEVVTGSIQLLDKPIFWSDFLKQRRLRHALIIGFGLALGQQFCGVNAIFYYAPKIMESTHFPPLVGSVGIAAFNVLVTLLAVFFVERLGRRKLLVAGYAGLTVSCAIMASFLMPSVNSSFVGAGYVAFVGTLGFVLAFELGPGPLFFVMISEIFPTKARGRASAICNGAAWASNLIVSFTFPMLTGLIGIHNCFIIFGVISLFVTIFTVFWVPETKGIPLEDIHI